MATHSKKQPLFQRTISVPLAPDFGFSKITIELAIPSLPDIASASLFAEHIYNRTERRATDTVVLTQRAGVTVSYDLGETWDTIAVALPAYAAPRNCFTLDNNTHLVQGRSFGALHRNRMNAPIALVDANWEVIKTISPGLSQWHGTQSIDQQGTTVIYGEYAQNAARHCYDTDYVRRRQHVKKGLIRPTAIIRSADNGHSWEQVLSCSPRSIRHFHTVFADPYQTKQWWASSGDTPSQSRVWRSTDDGVTWADVTCGAIGIKLPSSSEHRRQALHRFTSVAITPTELIWGTDDWMGKREAYSNLRMAASERVGARLCVTPKSSPLALRVVGFIGNPVRSIIDIGPAYLLATQADNVLAGYNPQVFLLSKKEPYVLQELFTVANLGTEPTKFTLSRASIAAKDGVFFTCRGANDAFRGGARVLRWRVAFD
jgi:hypothetical protein